MVKYWWLSDGWSLALDGSCCGLNGDIWQWPHLATHAYATAVLSKHIHTQKGDKTHDSSCFTYASRRMLHVWLYECDSCVLLGLRKWDCKPSKLGTPPAHPQTLTLNSGWGTAEAETASFATNRTGCHECLTLQRVIRWSKCFVKGFPVAASWAYNNMNSLLRFQVRCFFFLPRTLLLRKSDGGPPNAVGVGWLWESTGQFPDVMVAIMGINIADIVCIHILIIYNWDMVM